MNLKIWKKLAPRVGFGPPGIFGKFACKMAQHPAGPVWRGTTDGTGADLRCRACGELVEEKNKECSR